jgi:gliding motility-associated-like protein
MKKSLLILVTLVSLINFKAFAQPANNNCNTAQSLGSLPTPGACVGGLQNGSATTVAGTTIGATATSPAVSILNCQGGTADQQAPSLDVWYSFVATGTTVNVNITPGSPALATPNIGLWTGACNSLTASGCGIGNAAGNLTATFTQITVGQTYYIQVGGNTATSTGNFNLSVDNDTDCNDCLTTFSMTSSPAPIFGAYQPGQVVTFCYTISNWTIQNTNWLHGIQISMGAGWTGAISGAVPANTVQNIAGPGFDGAWYFSNTGLGTGFGPGFYFETVSGGTDASNNFGDNGTGSWTFCWNLTVDPGCSPGSDLSVTVNTSGDGESGSWSSLGCSDDPAYVFNAQGACCPPTMVSTPTCSGTNNGTATATPVGAGTFTYSWAPGGQTTQTATGLAAGTYTVTVTNTATLCASTNSVVVIASTAPVSNAGADITLCSAVSGSIGAAAVAGNTYLWSPTTSLSSSIVANPTVTITNPGSTVITTTYTVTTTNASGCTSTDAVIVTVNPVPVITAESNIVVCAGIAIPANTFVSTPAGASFAWTNSVTSIGLTGSGTTSTPGFTATNITSAPVISTVTVTPTLAGCPGPAITYTITVNPQPTSTFTQSPNQCLTGNSFAFTNTGSSGTGYTYSWNFGGGGASPATSTTNNQTVTYATAGTYTVTHIVTAPGGCTSSTTSSVTIFPMPVVTVTPSFTICAGAGTAENLTAAGAATYTWSPATGLSAITGATVTGNPAATTTYTVTGTSADGCTATASMTITVNPIPVIAATPITICAGTAGTLTASGATTYAWSPGTGLSATTGTSVSANPAATTTYTVTGTSLGCSATTTVTVTVNPLPVTVVNSPTICPTQTATLTASGATTYAWTAGLSSATGASVTGSPVSTTSYTVTGTSLGCTSTAVATITIGGSITPTVNSPTICAGQTATLTAGAATTYSWSSGLSATTGATVTGSPATTTSYTVTGTAGGCTGTAVATITVNPLPTITAAPIAICAGTPGTLTAAGAVTYAWAPATGLSATTGTSVTANPTATTTYTVTGTSATGCTNTTTVVVTVNPLPTVTVAPITICPGIAGTLTASGAFSYTWAAATGLSATTGATVSANPAATTTYTVTGTTAAGCTNTSAVIVTVNPSPVLSVAPITICSGIAGSLTVSGANTYTWSPATGLSATTGATVSANPAGTTTYTVTGTAATGCTATTTVLVTVTPAATLSIAKVNVLCFGGATGSATVTPVGGTTPYTYAWTPSGGTGATASGLAAGTYTVTVTTNNGCISTLTTTITQPAGMTLTMGTVNATCGASNGQASVTVAGGTSPYSYAWTPSGGSTSVANGLSAASYTVTVTDNNGCTSTNSVAVNNSLSPSASTTVITTVSCFGGSNGSASVSISGGTSPYTQSWSPSGGTGTTASGLTAGTYTVTVTDNIGCIVTANATITQPPLLSASTVATPVTCFAGTNGTATVTATGGTSPYTYSWAASGGTGATASTLAAGTYTVTVTDFKGCTVTATAVITQPTIVTGVASNTPVSCFGGTNGTASVVAGGGTPGYTYSWAATGGTAATASGLTSGTYTVTITDLNGCTRTTTTTITQPTLLTVTSTNVSSTCGFANGTATATPAGGTGAYSYSWAPSGGSAATATGLAAAAYTVTVTDANGCTATSTTTINDLSGLVAFITAQANVTCFGLLNGSVTVTASGSTGPYTYSINGGTTYQVSGTFASLAAGTYTIIAKDANGCTVSVPVTITQPTALSGAITAQTNILCNGASTGSVTVAGSGGTVTYTYAINGVTFGASGTFSSLAAGPYTVTVKDNNGCTTTVPVTITQPTPLTASISSQTNILCFGGNTGSVTIAAAGGTATYMYALNAGTPQSSGTFSSMTAGTYTVTVTDANSCTTTIPVTITQPTQVTVSATVVNATCGAANGSITAAGASGTPTYTYSLNGTTFQVGTTFTGLAATTYTVTVKDANGCTNTATVTVNDLSGLVASISSQLNVSCNGLSNGSVTVVASGSVPVYTFSINGGPFGASGTFGTLAAGSYTVTAKDGNGCTTTVPVTITQPAVLTGAISAQTNITCFGANNGSVTVTATGGTTAYTYSIDGGAFVASATFSGLTVGAHTIIVKDANGCTVSIPVTITQPTVLALTGSATNAICTAANGSATVTATGATPIYTYLWSPGGQITATASGITAGNYTVVVTDANGCTQSQSVSVGSNPGGTASVTSNNVSCTGSADGNATVSMSAAATPPYTILWSPSGQSTTTATNLAPGSYTVSVTDGNGCIATASTIITEPTIINGSFTNTNVSCFGGNNGSSTVNVTGGTGPYTYVWTPTGQTTVTAGGLTAGSYTCTITDANGCIKSVSTTITQPPAMGLTTSVIDANCGLPNGSATVTVAGGVGPYTYSWSTAPVQTTATATALASNTYVVTVTDANSCSQSSSVTVNNLAGPIATVFSITNVSCNGLTDGSATVTVSGGTAPYDFDWSNTQTLPTATNLAAGTYTLTATDVNGCIATTSATITEPLVLATTFTSSNPVCAGSANGTITTTTTGGTVPYTYSWSPGGASTSFLTGLTAGTYSLQVTDANGCITLSTVTLTNPAAILASTTTTNVSCSGMCNGSATVTLSSGTGPIIYAWSNSQSTPTATALCAGTYSVTATDANGCTATASAVITSPASLTVNITSTGNVTCFGACDGYSSAAVTGGSAPYSFLWNPGGTAGASVNNLCAATYTVVATDVNGCSASTTVLISQPNPLIATIVNTNVTCFGACDAQATAVYTGGTGPYTFIWTPSLQTTPTVTALCAGVQNLEVTDANGCTATNSVVITEPTVLAVSTTTTNSDCGSANGTACAAITGGSPPFTYSWNDPATQATSCATGLNAGVYTISVVDNNGCIVTNVANVNDNTAPIVSIVTSTNVTCSGAANGSAQGAVSGGTLPYTTSWTTTPAQTGTFANNLSGGTYSFVVTDGAGCTASAVVSITEPTPLISGIISSVNTTCNLSCDGSATVLAGGGTGPYTYLWNDVLSQTTTTATGLCAQSYSVTTTDAKGCTSLSVATITQPAAITINLVSLTNVSCNGGNNGQISVSVTGGTPGYTYAWVPSVGASSSVTNLVAGTYQLTVTDLNGCSKVMSYTITQPLPIVLSTTSNFSTCGSPNGSAGVSVSGGTSPYSFSWSPTPGGSAIITNLFAGTYNVIVTDLNGCTATASSVVADSAGPTITGFTSVQPSCNGLANGSVTVLATGGQPLYSYLWTGPGSQISQTASGLPAGVYNVTVSDENGCVVVGTVVLSQPSALTVIGAPSDTICIGQLSQVYGAGSGGTSPYSYVWNPSSFGTTGGPFVVTPTTTTSYTVAVTDANGCFSPATITTVVVNPQIDVVATDVSVCAGSSVLISAAATGGNGGPYTYSWSNGASGASQTVSPPAGSSTYNYIVTANDGGCSISVTDTATVTINPLAVIFMAVPDTAGCEDFLAEFTGLTNIPATFTWNFGDGSATGTGANIDHLYLNDGTYNVTLSAVTAFGCISSITNVSYIDVYPAPTAGFSSSPNPATSTSPVVMFSDESIGATSWAWDFTYVPSPGINTSTDQNPSFSYSETGGYIVQQVVTNTFGCTDTAYNNVEVVPEYVFYAPNAFSPLNHDGTNDLFMPKGIGFDPDHFEMMIFDRWGNLIYKTTDVNKGWDGKANGGEKVAQIDVYVWKVNTQDFLQKEHQYVGTVTLVK